MSHGQSTFGRLACPTDHLLPSTVHTHAYTYIHRREYVCEYDRDGRAFATDARLKARSRRQGLRASLGRPSHRHTDARRRRRRDVFHHGSRDVPPHDDDDDDDDDTSTTGDDRARRRCESRYARRDATATRGFFKRCFRSIDLSISCRWIARDDDDVAANVERVGCRVCVCV